MSRGQRGSSRFARKDPKQLSFCGAMFHGSAPGFAVPWRVPVMQLPVRLSPDENFPGDAQRFIPCHAGCDLSVVEERQEDGVGPREFRGVVIENGESLGWMIAQAQHMSQFVV